MEKDRHFQLRVHSPVEVQNLLKKMGNLLELLFERFL